jgi:PmbA protein
MSSELLEIARATVQSARKKGARDVRAAVYRSRESVVEWRNGKLDRVRESTKAGLSVSLYVDGRYSSNTTSDLRRDAIDRFLSETVAITRVLQPDPHRRLPDPRRYRGRHTGDLQLYDAKGAAEMTSGERRRVAAALEAGARAAPGAERILVVTSTCSDSRGESALVASNGMEGTRQGTTFSMFAMAVVKDVGARKPTGYWYASARQRAALPSPESVGREAARRANLCVGEKPAKSGLYPCIIENAVVERLLFGLLGPLSGNAIQQRRSFLAGRIGKTVAAPLLTITDEPLLPGGLDSRPYDGEGMSTVSRPVVEKGVLRTYFLDTYYANKLGMEPTIAEPTNLAFVPGKRDLVGLLRAVNNGILVTAFSGGNTNPANGDFSIGIRGQWIEKGEVVRPVAEMNLAGSHRDLWRKLEEVGSDPYLSSSVRSPSLRFSAMQFSGV